MRASAGGAARRMETKKDCRSNPSIKLSYPDNVVCKPFTWFVFISLDNQYFAMFDYADSIK